MVGLGTCTNPTGVPFIVDVEAAGCNITKDVNGQCSAHACNASHCAHEPSTTFEVDATTGCPRCRNFTGESLEDVFSCIADLGTHGCGFEMPLEAMHKALDPATTANAGFVRPDSVLAVVLVTDEDDCSASDMGLFDLADTSMTGPLGPLKSYRCFEFGITCDINDRTHEGTRHNCVPRDDPGAMLHPMSRYIAQLHGLHDPGRVVVAAIAGPVTLSMGGVGHDAVIGRDQDDTPQLQYTCTTATDGAVPGIRLYNFVEAFNTTAGMSWAYTSACSSDYTAPLIGVAQQIGTSF